MMIEYDPERPYWGLEVMGKFKAIPKNIALRYGPTVTAMPLSNREYQRRFNRFAAECNMMTPPSSVIHIMVGYLVVRKLGTPKQYETWMPEEVFEEIYQKAV